MGKKVGGVNHSQPWTNEEHRRFVEALEKHGDGSAGNEWALMAEYIGSRNPNEVQLHAQQYFMYLQESNTQGNFLDPQEERRPTSRKKHSHGNETIHRIHASSLNKGKSPLRHMHQSSQHIIEQFLASSTVDQMPVIEATTKWTAQEDRVFENALAIHGEDVPNRWERIAALIPGKEAADVYRRHQALFHDIELIEAGNTMTVRYAMPSPLNLPMSFSSPQLRSLSTPSINEKTFSPQKKIKREENSDYKGASPSSILGNISAKKSNASDSKDPFSDRLKRLTIEEENLLMVSIQETTLSQCYSPAARASVVDAVASLCEESTGKYRKTSPKSLRLPMFTKESAKHAVKEALSKVEKIIHENESSPTQARSSPIRSSSGTPETKSVAIGTLSSILRLHEHVKESLDSKMVSNSTCEDMEAKPEKLETTVKDHQPGANESKMNDLRPAIGVEKRGAAASTNSGTTIEISSKNKQDLSKTDADSTTTEAESERDEDNNAALKRSDIGIKKLPSAVRDSRLESEEREPASPMDGNGLQRVEESDSRCVKKDNVALNKPTTELASINADISSPDNMNVDT